MPVAVRPERILKDLAKLWVDLAKEEGEKNAAGVIRACAMTLIVGIEETEDAQQVGQTIAELIHEHPSRAIVLRVNKAGANDIDARVFAQCWMPFGRRQQICCEEIEITSPDTLLADVPKLMLGLTVPDLPVVLWARSPRLATHPEFQQLFRLANKIIIDSARFADPDAAYSYVLDANRGGRNVMDLAWTRLSRLRQLVAQIFENELCSKRIASLDHVTISHAGAISPVAARYLAAWFRNALPRAAVSRAPAATDEIALTGPDLAVSLKLEDATSAVLKINDLTRRAALPDLSEHALLREELSIVGVDPIFRNCLE